MLLLSSLKEALTESKEQKTFWFCFPRSLTSLKALYYPCKVPPCNSMADLARHVESAGEQPRPSSQPSPLWGWSLISCQLCADLQLSQSYIIYPCREQEGKAINMECTPNTPTPSVNIFPYLKKPQNNCRDRNRTSKQTIVA